MEKRWHILTADDRKITELQQCLGISRVLCKILVQRQLDSFEKAKNFFRPQLSQLHDPFLMKDMRKAVDRIASALAAREKILVFGDYDVDGTTAVACMYRFLCKIYTPAQVDFYIPNRYREGYGISRAGIDFARQTGCSLIISLDCGIKSVDLIGYAGQWQIDFIVCDHHLPDRELPPALAILNPKQPGCPYPYKELCGCGVGYKLITALSQHFGLPDDEHLCYLDLVMTAIGADLVPITGENRILAYFGLQKLNDSPTTGIKAIMELSGLKATFSINNVVFLIAPRVNAAGRMDDARKAVLLFIEEDYARAKQYAAQLHSDNADRKETDAHITEEALAIIASDDVLVKRNTTVVFKAAWHKGVVGIVASRLIENYYRPTVVLAQSGDYVGGSARSVPGFNLYEAIHSCREFLIGYGGHFAAAGVTMLPEHVLAFSNKFEEIVTATIDPRLLVQETVIDAEIDFKDITPALYRILHQMEPFGPDNLRPVFMTKNISETSLSRIVKDLHIRFALQQGGVSINGIGFNLSGKFKLLQMEQPVDIVYAIEENEWNGKKNLQLKVIDFRLSGPHPN